MFTSALLILLSSPKFLSALNIILPPHITGAATILIFTVCFLHGIGYRVQPKLTILQLGDSLQNLVEEFMEIKDSCEPESGKIGKSLRESVVSLLPSLALLKF
ncbi:hypothetical protein H2248_003026 [Termitomyces sp. 'cryptogamus']|nr:hypothetical protein H2248_003026 [Termitomyces sp. 'cryptogamus']